MLCVCPAGRPKYNFTIGPDYLGERGRYDFERVANSRCKTVSMVRGYIAGGKGTFWNQKTPHKITKKRSRSWVGWEGGTDSGSRQYLPWAWGVPYNLRSTRGGFNNTTLNNSVTAISVIQKKRFFFVSDSKKKFRLLNYTVY